MATQWHGTRDEIEKLAVEKERIWLCAVVTPHLAKNSFI